MALARPAEVTLHSSIAKPSSSESALQAWPADEAHSVVHVRSEHPGMDEFGSEHQRHESPSYADTPSAWSDWSRDEWAFRIVTGVAIAEALILIIAGVSLSGILSANTGTIIVESQPAAAEVRLDGNIAGTTPLTLTAAEGRRSLEIRHQQGVRTMTIDVTRGETTRSLVEFVPIAPPAEAPPEVRVTSEPPSAQVSIDGVPRGSTPLVVSQLTPGVHAVSIRGRGGVVNRSITVAAGRPQSLHVLLPAPPAEPGFVSVTTTAPLRVLENGRVVGASGSGPIAMSPGAHDLEFVNDELGLRVRQRVVIHSGGSTAIAPTLPRGTLAINAQPWAEVWLGGERIGETPIGNLSRPVGQYDVLLRHPDLGERRARVRVTSEATTRLNVDMRQRVDVP
jgi:hypothetical protein